MCSFWLYGAFRIYSLMSFITFKKCLTLTPPSVSSPFGFQSTYILDNPQYLICFLLLFFYFTFFFSSCLILEFFNDLGSSSLNFLLYFVQSTLNPSSEYIISKLYFFRSRLSVGSFSYRLHSLLIFLILSFISLNILSIYSVKLVSDNSNIWKLYESAYNA